MKRQKKRGTGDEALRGTGSGARGRPGRPLGRRSGAVRRSGGSHDAGAEAQGGGLELFREELEIPTERLLDHDEELSRARRIGTCMSRLRRVLPRHPAGVARYLARMQEVGAGLSAFFSWQSMRENVLADARSARREIERARRAAPRGGRGADRAYERCAEILLRYPLDPETLYQWAVDAAKATPRAEAEWELDAARKAMRLLPRLLWELDQQRDGFLLPNLRLVLNEVFRFPAKGMHQTDLFQEGFLGLQKAVFRFDPERKLRFSTYATHWIRQSIRKALIDKSCLIRIPQNVQWKLYRDRGEIASDEADRIRRLRRETTTFSALSGEEDDSPFDVKDLAPTGVAKTFRTDGLPRAVAKALQKLDDQAREVVLRRFGLGGARRQTLEEVGSHLNLSRERIRQIEKEALERLRVQEDLAETYEDLGLVESSLPV